MRQAFESSTGRDGRWIPWIFVAGMAVVVAVNLVMVWLAIDSSPGLVSEHPFERGLAYNKVLASEARQEALGWRVEIAFRPATHEVVAEFHDRDGAPVGELRVEAHLYRPLEADSGASVTLRYAGDGRYVGAPENLRRGQWQVELVASRAGGDFQASRRLIVP